MPDLSIEQKYNGIIAGVDEAGRGPWAGPVVAGAVILDRNNIPLGINDSKKISAKKREIIFEQLMQTAQVGVGIVSVAEIDQINILQAAMLAMTRAVEELPVVPDMALIDGNRCPALSCDAQAIVKGDTKSLSIAAGAIIAKVTRDRIMAQIGQQYPQYGWEQNSGYGTKQHQEALAQHGVTSHHRRSFKPIAALLQDSSVAVA